MVHRAGEYLLSLRINELNELTMQDQCGSDLLLDQNVELTEKPGQLRLAD